MKQAINYVQHIGSEPLLYPNAKSLGGCLFGVLLVLV